MQREYRILCRMQRSRSVHFRILRRSVCCSEVQAEPFRLSVQLRVRAELLQQASAELLQREQLCLLFRQVLLQPQVRLREQAERLPEYRISCRSEERRLVNERRLRKTPYHSKEQTKQLK